MSFVDQDEFDILRDYVNAELPARAALLRPALANGYNGDPTLSTEPIINNAPEGSWYQQNDGTLWQKVAPAGAANWTMRASGTAGGTAGGWVRIVDVVAINPSDTITNKVFQDTGNTIIQSFTTTGLDIRLTIESSYPKITVNGNLDELSKTATDIYSGTADVTLPPTGGEVEVITFTGDDVGGGVDTTAAAYIAPPAITTLNFTGGYPGVQTELKEGDSFDIYVEADRDFDQVVIDDFEACQSAAIGVAVGQTATVTSTIADRGDTAVARPARVRVRDAVTGALSDPVLTNAGGSVDGTNVVTCNNLAPTVTIGTITYPLTQAALKASENATVANTLANYDSVLYDSPNGDLSITSPTTAQDPKTVQRIAGTFNNSIPNLRITAIRNANAAVTIDQDVVVIANVAPTITVVTPATRLRSGGNNGTVAQDHTISLQSNQPLLSAPTLNPATGGNRGSFVDSFAGGPSTWTRTFRVDETVPDEKGIFTWSGLAATGLAGLVQNTISVGASYTLGGFVQRDLTFAAFATTTSIGTEVGNFSKLSAGIFTSTNQPALKQSIGTPPSVTDGYTINATGVNPTTLIWLDTAAAGANSGGTAQITDVEETV